MRAPLFVILAVAAVGCGRTHTLQDGPYAFGLVETLRDDCQLAKAPDVFSTGVLRTTGHVVTLDYGLFGIDLVGNYLDDVERMLLDGSAANVNTPVNGEECLLDLVSIHLEGTTRGPGAFDGTMAVRLDARRPDRCVCELWVRYQATKSAAPAPP